MLSVQKITYRFSFTAQYPPFSIYRENEIDISSAAVFIDILMLYRHITTARAQENLSFLYFRIAFTRCKRYIANIEI